MSQVRTIHLPDSVAALVPDTSGVVRNEMALASLTAVSKQLALHLDQWIERFERLAVLRELSCHVAYGLRVGDPASGAAFQDPRLRPPRYGFPADVLGIAARIALERAIVVSRFGEQIPSEEEVALLVTLSSMHMDADVGRELAGLPRDADKPRMGSVAVCKTGKEFVWTYEPEDFDLLRYQQLRDTRTLDSDSADNTLISAFGAGTPDEFIDISEAMVKDLGFGLIDLFDVIVFAHRLNLQYKMQFLPCEVEKYRSAMKRESRRWLAAFDYLTFSAEHLDANDLRPSSTRHQKRRILTHPFIVDRELLILNRDILFESLHRWARYFLNGDWPAPASVRQKWPTLDAAIMRRRNARGTQSFEPFVEAELDRIGLPWGSTSGANREIGRARLTGEIDAFVVDVRRGILWVIEAKDVTSDQNLRSLQREIMKMINSYWPQVARAAAEVEADPGAAATHALRGWGRHGIVSAGDLLTIQRDIDNVSSWEVRPLIVVRDRSAAEYLIGRTWDICSVSGLYALLVDG